jgi:hypothetical protein
MQQAGGQSDPYCSAEMAAVRDRDDPPYSAGEYKQKGLFASRDLT